MIPTRIHLSTSRSERLDDIRAIFFNHSGPNLTEDWKGGRTERLRRLQEIKPSLYGKTRNYLNGAVTKLSPYLRHGCISLNEAIQLTKEISVAENEKLLFEFAWRDYWRHIWYMTGERIHSEMEPPKVKLGKKPLPPSITTSQTDLPCIDTFVQTLKATGYLHNHARMWLSSYLIHWEKVDWREAAKWMHDLLLDGDEASNTLSWQWVASTFGSKPYFFNQENLSKYTNNQLCAACQTRCPFNHTYESLNASLFERSTAPAKISSSQEFPAIPTINGTESIILFNDEMLSINHPLYDRKARKVFIFDVHFYQNWALNRLQFVADCLAEMPGVEVWTGDRLEVLAHLNAGSIETQMTPNTALRKQLSAYKVTYVDEQSIYPEKVREKLTQKGVIRFSKYWNEVGAELLRPK